MSPKPNHWRAAHKSKLSDPYSLSGCKKINRIESVGLFILPAVGSVYRGRKGQMYELIHIVHKPDNQCIVSGAIPLPAETIANSSWLEGLTSR